MFHKHIFQGRYRRTFQNAECEPMNTTARSCTGKGDITLSIYRNNLYNFHGLLLVKAATILKEKKKNTANSSSRPENPCLGSHTERLLFLWPQNVRMWAIWRTVQVPVSMFVGAGWEVHGGYGQHDLPPGAALMFLWHIDFWPFASQRHRIPQEFQPSQHKGGLSAWVIPAEEWEKGLPPSPREGRTVSLDPRCSETETVMQSSHPNAVRRSRAG